MMIWRLLFLVGVVAGCATTPAENPWESVEVQTDPAQRPLDPGDWPDPVGFSEDTVIFDLEGAQALQAYQITAEANAEIAAENANQVDDLNKAATDLVAAGQAQRRVATLTQEILEEERKHWFWERLSYWAGIVIILGAATL